MVLIANNRKYLNLELNKLTGEIPKELWDKESEEEFFDLKIALQDELCCDIREIFAYFPTKLAVDFPFIIHGTFELNSSRNEINDSEKNRFILRELVKLIIDTAKSLTKSWILDPRSWILDPTMCTITVKMPQNAVEIPQNAVKMPQNAENAVKSC